MAAFDITRSEAYISGIHLVRLRRLLSMDEIKVDIYYDFA